RGRPAGRACGGGAGPAGSRHGRRGGPGRGGSRGDGRSRGRGRGGDRAPHRGTGRCLRGRAGGGGGGARSVTGLEVAFGGLAVLAVSSALLAVTSPRVVHCALWLVVTLGSLAGVYLALGAEVVALVQLLVYVGAVVVLVLFALMLTRAPIRASRNL